MCQCQGPEFIFAKVTYQGPLKKSLVDSQSKTSKEIV